MTTTTTRTPTRPPAPTEAARLRSVARGLESFYRWLFLLPAVLYMLLFFGFPVYQNLVMSFQNYTTTTFYTGVAPWVGFANYAQVLSSSVFSTAAINTLLFTAVSIVVSFAIGMSLAVFFRKKFALNGILRSLLLLPWLLPHIATSAVWKSILDKDSGVLNSVLETMHLTQTGVPWLTSPDFALISVIAVSIWGGIPFYVTLLYGGLQDVPDELYEAAAIDGATGWRAFWNVTWPMLRPVIGVVLLLGIIHGLRAMDIILALTGGGPANATQSIATQSYNLSFQQFLFGQGSALTNILGLVSLVFALVYLRASRRGVED